MPDRESREHAVADLPHPSDRRAHEPESRIIVLAAVVSCGVGLVAVVVGMVYLGTHSQGVNEVATTGLAAIGSTLAGGFAGWIARGQVDRSGRRKTD